MGYIYRTLTLQSVAARVSSVLVEKGLDHINELIEAIAIDGVSGILKAHDLEIGLL